MSEPIIYRHAETICPQCGYRLSALAQAGGIVEAGVPAPGDLVVCFQCRSVLQLSAIGGYRVLPPQDVAALSDDERIDLEATQAHLALYDAWRRQREDMP